MGLSDLRARPAHLSEFVPLPPPTTSPTRTVKLTNVGATQLDITGITLTGANSGNFAQSNTLWLKPPIARELPH